MKIIEFFEKRKIFPILLAILFAADIFIISSIPGTLVSKSAPSLSIVYHFSIFFLFSFFLIVSLQGKENLNFKYFIMVVLISIAYAFLDEFHQIFTPLRTPSLSDVLIDSAGIFSSGIIYLFGRKE